MTYDFDRVYDRRGTASLKWDVKDGELPMWVADMDFPTAPAITEAIRQRAESGIFGYTSVPDEWNHAICDWWSRRYHFSMEPDWLIFCTGIVPAISSIVRKMTTIGENVLVQTPVYHIFFNCILNNGRHVLENKLILRDGEYEIDFDDLEKKLADPQTTLMLLCNPHNPIGKIWDKETLRRIGELCRAHDVLVVSDEIHCDLTDPGCVHTPFASISEACRQNSITCISPTKTFNLAGLQTAAVMVPDKRIRFKVERGLNTDEVAEPNAFAVTAAVAAYTHGAEWLDALRAYLYENKKLVQEFLTEKLPQVKLTPLEATYLLWLDCSAISGDSRELARFLREKTGLWLSDGKEYRESDGCFLRMNIACPRARLLDGLTRLKQGMDGFIDFLRGNHE